MTQNFKLVPMEPTDEDEMEIAACKVFIRQYENGTPMYLSPHNAIAVFEDMLSAAPDVAGEPVAYAEQDNIDMKSYNDLSFSYPVSTKPTENRTAPLYANPQLSRTAELEDKVKRLSEMLLRIMGHTVIQVVACNGLKCREPVCESCSFDAEEAAQKAANDVGEARALLAEIGGGV